MRFLSIVAVAIMGAFAIMACVTLYWTLSGHCCGSPLVTAGWRDCMPVQDKEWLTKVLSPNTHCDARWQRVPD